MMGFVSIPRLRSWDGATTMRPPLALFNLRDGFVLRALTVEQLLHLNGPEYMMDLNP